MSPQAAISRTVMKSRIPKALVDSGRDDDTNADGHRPEQDRERGGVLLDNFLPQVIGSYLVDDEKCSGKNSNADRCVNDCIHNVAKLGAHLLASCVVMVAVVDRAIRAGVIANGPGNVLHLVHRVETPSSILRHRQRAEHNHAVKNVQISDHESLPFPNMLPRVNGRSRPFESSSLESAGAVLLSAPRECSKFMDRQVMSPAGTSRARSAIPKKLTCGTSRLAEIE